MSTTVAPTFLIYGANGYTGTLISREAARRGRTPVLAGRSEHAVAALAAELGLPHVIFGLHDPARIDEVLAPHPEVRAILHCAGPFAHTYRAMAEACLRRRLHYLDITGEVTVFEELRGRDAEARAAGVMLLPGVGFDVVPSDCLAAHLKGRLPGATHLALGFQMLGRASRGTATTMAENVGKGGLIRRNGRLTSVPGAWRTRVIDFGRGPTTAVTIPWGDISTAYHSTGIPNIEVYMAAPAVLRLFLRSSRYIGGILASGPAQRLIKDRIRAGPPGPTDAERASGLGLLWGEVSDGRGGRAESWLEGPEGYTLTVMASLEIVRRVLAGEAPPGFQTPSRAYGPDLVLAVEGAARRDG